MGGYVAINESHGEKTNTVQRISMNRSRVLNGRNGPAGDGGVKMHKTSCIYSMTIP